MGGYERGRRKKSAPPKREKEEEGEKLACLKRRNRWMRVLLLHDQLLLQEKDGLHGGCTRASKISTIVYPAHVRGVRATLENQLRRPTGAPVRVSHFVQNVV
jgi:hypothetical protein